MLKSLLAQLCTVSTLAAIVIAAGDARAADVADLILHHGKLLTVDAKFQVAEAIAIRDGKILAVGSNPDVLALGGPATRIVDLEGRMLLPGLIDSHVHPTGACMTEFAHPVPDMQCIQDVLDYIRARAEASQPGDWISVSQVFITRLREQRWPTRAELDAAAPRNPVVFSTGPDASVNSLALAESGIDKDFVPTGAGKIERDPATGEPTGILRSASRYIKSKPKKDRKATESEKLDRLALLFADYNACGLTGIVDRHCSPDSIPLYVKLKDSGRQTVRIALSHSFSNTMDADEAVKKAQQIAAHPLRAPNPWLRIVGVKTFLDGGMLTGSAYMREPWGVSQIYSIDDPRYQGMLYIEPERLEKMVRAVVEAGMQFTAHSVGDGAVTNLLAAYEKVNQSTPIAATRPCLTHSNFMTEAAVAQCAKLGVVIDIQPAWLWLDTHTLAAQFGYDRLRWFQPLKSLFAQGVTVGGGSDHMQKIGPRRSINFYDPWLAMWVAITRNSQHYSQPLHPEEALSREQAIRFYTINNARLMFLEDQLGSLEPGKLADLIVVDRDLLTCPIDDLRETKVLQTFVSGKQVYAANNR
ncbi:MAG TPA: amidohydrolase family protein [Pirellulales bacterium]|nr:amidohydrolase family protein [Pirellulales bacterium]